MAVIKKLKAVKTNQNHLLGVQDLSISQITEILNQAKTFMNDHTTKVSTWDEFKKDINDGFVICGWDGNEETEIKIKQETKATIRCLPFDQDIQNIKCIYTNNPAQYLAVFSKAY